MRHLINLLTIIAITTSLNAKMNPDEAEKYASRILGSFKPNGYVIIPRNELQSCKIKPQNGIDVAMVAKDGLPAIIIEVKSNITGNKPKLGRTENGWQGSRKWVKAQTKNHVLSPSENMKRLNQDIKNGNFVVKVFTVSGIEGKNYKTKLHDVNSKTGKLKNSTSVGKSLSNFQPNKQLKIKHALNKAIKQGSKKFFIKRVATGLATGAACIAESPIIATVVAVGGTLYTVYEVGDGIYTFAKDNGATDEEIMASAAVTTTVLIGTGATVVLVPAILSLGVGKVIWDLISEGD